MNIFHRFSVKSLKKNRTRTIVTIIGIILSTAMLTAVTTIIVSIQAYGIAYETKRTGDWFVKVMEVNAKELFSLREDARVKELYGLSCIGYAYLEGGVNDYKPYLCIQAMDEEFANHMPIELTEGRLPENSTEILMPNHVEANGGVSFELGETLKLAVGYREAEDGRRLWQQQGLLTEESDASVQEEETEVVPQEHLTALTDQTYTIVGFYNRPDFENYTSPGYTALTAGALESGEESCDLYLILNRPKDAIDLFNEISGQGVFQAECNSSLLRFYGVSNRSDFLTLLYGMGGILITIIVIGSVALIYNAFAISVSERTKQFGVLSSIGATGRQMKKTVCFEALLLCIIGIPLGVLSGIGGIGVTLSLCADSFEYLVGTENGVEMKTVISASAVVPAVVIGVITIVISAYLPMRRALKNSAIDTIRQSRDIRLTKQSLKTPGWVLKCFGLEGMIAWKNFKRNKRQYRATLFSLALSILLFISAGSFSEYLFGSYRRAVAISNYDINILLYHMNYSELMEKMDEINALGGTEPVYLNIYAYLRIEAEEGALTEEAGQWADELYAYKGKFPAVVQFFPDDIFEEMTAYYQLDGEKYYDSSNPRAVVLNSMVFYQENGILEFQALSEQCTALKGDCFGESDEEEFIIEIGDVVKNHPQDSGRPEFTDRYIGWWSEGNGVKFVYPLSMAEHVLKQEYFSYNINCDYYVTAENHKETAQKIGELLKDTGSGVFDVAEEEEDYRAVMMMVQLFSYGFITLISLICAANIFNTISTNMGLRRREFAMLKSVGMTEKGFGRMLNFECLLYGLKGFCAGILVSVPTIAFMYYFSNKGSFQGFYLPARYVAIAAFCVFAVVYASMLYGKGRLKRENILDALKS